MLNINALDIVIHDKNKRECLFIDITVPNCLNVVSKEAEKITKYRNLEVEVQKYWNLKKICTVPVVIEALVSVYKGVKEYVKVITPNAKFEVIQRTALLGIAYILCNVLTPYKNLLSNIA